MGMRQAHGDVQLLVCLKVLVQHNSRKFWQHSLCRGKCRATRWTSWHVLPFCGHLGALQAVVSGTFDVTQREQTVSDRRQ